MASDAESVWENGRAAYGRVWAELGLVFYGEAWVSVEGAVVSTVVLDGVDDGFTNVGKDEWL